MIGGSGGLRQTHDVGAAGIGSSAALERWLIYGNKGVRGYISRTGCSSVSASRFIATARAVAAKASGVFH